MSEGSKVLVASVAGAVLGGVFGFLYLTERGRRVLNQVDPQLDRANTEIRRWRETIGKAQDVVAEARRSISGLTRGHEDSSQWPGPTRQAAPF